MPLVPSPLLAKIDRDRLPRHVAIIMDGNGRWARQRHLPRLWGHRAGTRSVREIVETAGALGIQALTLYAFSTENWSRPQREIDGLMRLLKAHLRRETQNLDRNNVRLETIGDIRRLPADAQAELARAKAALADNTGLRLVLALNYGGRQDILQAVRSLIEDGVTAVDEQAVNDRLQTAGLPELDLVIRTSGEMRISNFLLWQIAYAELHVTPVLWPDFRSEDFYQAILAFQSRERRFGAVV